MPDLTIKSLFPDLYQSYTTIPLQSTAQTIADANNREAQSHCDTSHEAYTVEPVPGGWAVGF